jgi:HSP20 family protein
MGIVGVSQPVIFLTEVDMSLSLSPYRDVFMAPVEDEFNRLFDRFFGPDSLHSVRSRGRSGYPKLDVIETDEKYVVEVEVPGINPDDLKVEITPLEDQAGNKVPNKKVLKLSGKKDYDYQYPDGTTWHIKEVRRSQFVRELLLPDYVDDSPSAEYERGILRLSWEKPEDRRAVKPKLIEIAKKA